MLASSLSRMLAIATAIATGTFALAAPASAHQRQALAHRPEATVTAVPLAAGLYQSGYSARNHALWVTRATGRPPVTASALVKVNPHSLNVSASYSPPVTDAATGAVQAVYGIAVDDKRNTVWTTNTRDNSVSVYSQRTGEVLATFPNVSHAREVTVDVKHDTAWATGFGDGTLVAFDTRTLTETRRITVAGTTPAGVTVDPSSGTVYATALGTDQIIAVTRHSDTPRLIPAGDGPISISLSANGRTAYTADQAGGTVSVIDLRTGVVVKSIPTGSGPLSVATDGSGDVLVANRTSATVSIVDPRRGVVEQTLAVGANPNHVEVAGHTAYVTDKSASGPAGEDQLNVIHLP